MKDKTKSILKITLITSSIVALLVIYRRKILNVGQKIYYDVSNDFYVENLHPTIRVKVRNFLNWMVKNTDWIPILTSGLRTFSEQKALNLENPNNAEAGYSEHNYGFAFDMNIKNTATGVQLKKNSSKQNWIDSGIPAKAKEFGFNWGGNLYTNYYDPVHFVFSDAPSTKELLAQYNAGNVDEFGYVKV